MLGRDVVRDHALRRDRELDERAATGERRRDDRAPRHLPNLSLGTRRNRVDHRGVGRDEDRLGKLVVLGLREEIHRDPVGVGAAVRDDEDLGRSGDHVDADGPEYAPLGRGDIRIAGSADLVDRRDRGRAIGERGDRLRAADREGAGYSGKMRGREHQRIARAAGRRDDHHDLGDARDMRRDHGHQHR